MGLYVILFSSLYSVFQSLYNGRVVFVIFATKEKGKAGRERDKERKRERGNRRDRAPECCVALLRNPIKVFDKAACLFLWERDDGHALEKHWKREGVYTPHRKVKRGALSKPSGSQGQFANSGGGRHEDMALFQGGNCILPAVLPPPHPTGRGHPLPEQKCRGAPLLASSHWPSPSCL